MGKGSGGGAILGYTLGMGVIIPFCFYLYSVFIAPPNTITETDVNRYIKNSIELLDDSAVEATYWEVDSSNHKLSFQIKNYYLYHSKNNEGRKQYFGDVFYSKKYQKYFMLITIPAVEGGGAFDNVFNGINGEYMDISLTVNKEEFDNPAYGTEDNPAPVLRFTGIHKSIRSDKKDYDEAFMDTIFHRNVRIYLKYIMPKKEFKARYRK